MHNPRKRARTPDPEDYPFVFYGQPLPPLDPEIRDDGTYVPLWKQEVRDEKGRKRLHGAFTGGFSAGYFNTVGSKEGILSHLCDAAYIKQDGLRRHFDLPERIERRQRR